MGQHISHVAPNLQFHTHKHITIEVSVGHLSQHLCIHVCGCSYFDDFCLLPVSLSPLFVFVFVIVLVHSVIALLLLCLSYGSCGYCFYLLCTCVCDGLHHPYDLRLSWSSSSRESLGQASPMHAHVYLSVFIYRSLSVCACVCFCLYVLILTCLFLCWLSTHPFSLFSFIRESSCLMRLPLLLIH